jgi:hypothetical protein
MGAAWAWHAMCESAFKTTFTGHVPLRRSVIEACTSSKIRNRQYHCLENRSKGLGWKGPNDCLEDLNADGRATKFILKTQDGLHYLHSSSVGI